RLRYLFDSNSGNVRARLDDPWSRNGFHVLVHCFRVHQRHKLRHVDPGALAVDGHRQLVAKDLGPGTAQAWQAQVLAHQRGSHNVKFLQRDYAIDLCFAREKRQQIDEQRWTSIVWNSDQVVETVARPIFAEHLFFRDQNDIAAMFLALTNEVSAFEIGGEADDVEGAIGGFRHWGFFF